MTLEDGDGAIEEFAFGNGPVAQATQHEDNDALPDKVAYFIFRAQRQAEFGKHGIAGGVEVGDGIEQGAVEIEGDRGEAHVRPP